MKGPHLEFTWGLLFIIAALVCFVLATLKIPELPRFSYGWAGLLFWCVAMTFFY